MFSNRLVCVCVLTFLYNVIQRSLIYTRRIENLVQSRVFLYLSVNRTGNEYCFIRTIKITNVENQMTTNFNYAIEVP